MINYDITDESLIDYLAGLETQDNPHAHRGVAYCDLWGLVEDNEGNLQLAKICITERSEHGSLVALVNLLQTIKAAEQFGLSLSRDSISFDRPEKPKRQSQTQSQIQKPTEELYQEPDL